jgi:hypothetical protein
MSRTTVGAALLLVGNLIVGYLSGKIFFGLFLDNLPPLALSTFSSKAAHAAYLAYGLGLGVLLFGWCLVILLLSRFFVRPAGSLVKSS